MILKNIEIKKKMPNEFLFTFNLRIGYFSKKFSFTKERLHINFLLKWLSSNKKPAEVDNFLKNYSWVCFVTPKWFIG